jgi:hypothetical protein
MKLRTVVIATLLSYARFFREGDNEYPKVTLTAGRGATAEEVLAYASSVIQEATSTILGSGIIIDNAYPLEPAKLGMWLVFERLILLRYQGLPNQGRSTPTARTMAQTPKPPNGWVAMTMPAFLRAIP